MITKCGIYGIYKFNASNTITETIDSLHKLQHRGRESCGISYVNHNKLITYKNIGLVKDVFKNFDKNILTHSCIGHVRYSTSGISKKGNIIIENIIKNEVQPFTIKDKYSIAYNGNIKNFKSIASKFNLSNINIDTELIINILESFTGTLESKLIEFIKKINGVFCLILLTKNELFCLRDSFGVRPLSIATNFQGFYISSESCSLPKDAVITEVKPGELIRINKNGIKTLYKYDRNCQSVCIFEHIYFMNKDSEIYGEKLEKIRYNIGKKFAEIEKIKFSKDNTFVIGCPETGVPYGKGYAEYLNLKYVQYLIKTKESGRTFILPKNNERILACKKNLALIDNVKDKNIVLLDDSLVRGNTLKVIINTIKTAGAKSVHIRITSPPVKHPCYFGIDIPTFDELIAHKLKINEIQKYINADSLEYLDINIIKEEVGKLYNFCSACFDGNYNNELLDW